MYGSIKDEMGTTKRATISPNYTVSFQDEDTLTCFGQQTRSGQSTYSCTNHNDIILLFHAIVPFFLSLPYFCLAYYCDHRPEHMWHVTMSIQMSDRL
jgi:hypothetical protein